MRKLHFDAAAKELAITPARLNTIRYEYRAATEKFFTRGRDSRNKACSFVDVDGMRHFITVEIPKYKEYNKRK